MAGMQERDIVLQAEEGLFNEMHSGLVGRRLQAAEFTGAARFSTDSVVQELHDQPLYAKALRALVQEAESEKMSTVRELLWRGSTVRWVHGVEGLLGRKMNDEAFSYGGCSNKFEGN